MPSQRVDFTGSQGHALAGRLDTPDGNIRGWALFAHCFTCSKDNKAAAYIARALADAGFGVLRFDFTGLGGSGGDFAHTHFSSNVDDLVAAADWLRAQHGPAALLVGHSLGGAAVLAAAGRIAEARAVATLGAPCSPGHVAQQFGPELALIQSEGRAEVTLGGRPFTIAQRFIDDVLNQPQAERIRALRLPLLVLHAPLDQVVDISNARHLFETALHPKSFVALDGANHLLTRAEDARYAAGVIAAWAARYLPAEPTASGVPAGPAGPPSPTVAPSSEGHDPAPATVPAGTVHVRERGTGALAVSIRAGRHSLIGDEPVALGGDDTGPSPYELLLAALGECTVMTLRMFAHRKQWPLEDSHVMLTHAKVQVAVAASAAVSAETGADPAAQASPLPATKIDRIERRITLLGPLSTEQRSRLLEIADRCPVHRTLLGQVDVITVLNPAAT